MEVNDFGMDLTKIYVVRSAKGVDMLCVDDFLYHFDRIGKNNTYRWLCNRRKDKLTPCKSRISTVLPNPLDNTTHVVVDVAMAHTHPRCSDHEITKVSQRKRLSNLNSSSDSYSPTQPKRARIYERATAAQTPPVWISTGSLNPTSPGDMKTTIHLDFEDKDHVYMLRRRDGRVMVCIDGHLYYLGGRSYKGDIYRWTCVRQRDIECTAKICTEATLAGGHRLRAMDSDAHIHPHYSATKLTHMFAKHQIMEVEDEQTVEVLDQCPDLEYFDPEVPVGYDSEQIMNRDDLESLIIEECEESFDTYMQMATDEQEEDEDEAEPDEHQALLSAFNWPNGAEIIENYVPPAGHNPLIETDLTKFTFLPSAKGRKVLCLNRHLFHFDSQSRSNGHMFFTCILRRDKQHSCHVRVTLKPNSEELGEPVVLRINGEHTHEPDLDEIEKRINRQNKQKRSAIKQEEPDYDEQDDAEAEESEEEQFDHEYEQQPELRRNVVMKKVIGIDGIKLEPESNQQESKANMIVQYLKDGADNISAKIEILPNALEDVQMDERRPSPPQPQITNERRRKAAPITAAGVPAVEADMDLTKICTLRSAKGSEMLCVDGYIYHAKNRGLISRNYWVCIKSRDPEINCKSRISTATQKDGSIRVLRVYNSHSHPYSEDDIKRRMFNEINKKCNKKLKFTPLHFVKKSLDQIKQEYGDLAIGRFNVSNLTEDIVVHKKQRLSAGSSRQAGPAAIIDISAHKSDQDEEQSEEPHEQEEDASDDQHEHEQEQQQDDEDEEEVMHEDQYVTIEESEVPIIMDNTDAIIEVVEEVADMDTSYGSIVPIYTMKLYAVSDGPPSLAVRMTLKALDIQYQLINVDFCALEHRSEEYAKMNPQREIPVLDDDGFYLSESIAIMQYLCDKYGPSSSLYPQDANQRALVNQRLCFNMGFYYSPISAHGMAPIFFDYERTPMSLKRVQNALEVFETYLQRLGTKYAAGDDVTIADFALISATLCLEAIDFDLSPYALVHKWYETFKAEYPELWAIANSGMQEIQEFEQNPPDLSHVNHPFHPTRKTKV